MQSMPRWLPYAILTLSALVFFGPLVLHPNQVLYSPYSDFFAEHVPAKTFVAQSYHQTGELPLWCPYLFSGEPLAADLQVGMFYPYHLLLLYLPETWLVPGLSWGIVLHVMAAGWFMFAYARSQGLGQMGALVAAWGYMFSPKWMVHLLTAGHYITLGMTWIPLTLLFLDIAVRKRCLLAATAAGCSFGLLILCTHPQWILYGGILVVLWSLGPVVERSSLILQDAADKKVASVEQEGEGRVESPNAPTSAAFLVGAWRTYRHWAGYGLWALGIAVALAAIQLLPTAEMSHYTSRRVGIPASDSVAGGVRALLNLVGPVIQYRPDTVNATWEDRGGLGVWWLAAAIAAWILSANKLVRYQATVGLIVLLFALGGSVLLEWLPGFKYFRQPSRMLIIAAFPVAYLAGVTTAALWAGVRERDFEECRFVFSRVFALALLARCGDVVVHWVQYLMGRSAYEPFHFHPYWVSLPATGVAVWYLFRSGSKEFVQRRWLWLGILLVDLLAMSWPQVAVRPLEEIYPTSDTLRFLASHREEQGRVLDRDGDYFGSQSWGSPLGPGAPLAPIWRIEAVRGYNPLDLMRYKEYLQFLSGEDKPLEALAGPLMGSVMANFSLACPRLLDPLNVRYVVVPKDESFTEPRLAGTLTVALAASPMTAVPLLVGATVAGNDALALQQAGWQKVFEDPAPTAYNFLWGGVQTTGPYVIYENTKALPRAYVVAEAMPLPSRPEILATLKATDFRQRVLLEDWAPRSPASFERAPLAAVRVKEFRPNEVILDVAGSPAGFLVLSDIWYPGWTCRVDGQPVTVHRANFLFRAIELPAGAGEVVFRFEPASYLWGKRVTWGAMALVVAVALVLGMQQYRLARRIG